MTKGDIIKFLEPFTDKIDFIIPYKGGLDYCGVLTAKYFIDASGEGHISLIPAIDLYIIHDRKE